MRKFEKFLTVERKSLNHTFKEIYCISAYVFRYLGPTEKFPCDCLFKLDFVTVRDIPFVREWFYWLPGSGSIGCQGAHESWLPVCLYVWRGQNLSISSILQSSAF